MEMVLKEENKENRNAILDLEFDIHAFFNEFILKLPFERKLKNKYHDFLRKFSKYFVSLQSSGKFNPNIILK